MTTFFQILVYSRFIIIFLIIRRYVTLILEIASLDVQRIKHVVIFYIFSGQMAGLYIQIGYDHILPNSCLITIHNNLPL